VEELQKHITAQLEGRMVVRPTEPEEKFSIPEKSVLYLPLITLSSNGSIPNTLLESLEDGRLETMADHFATTKGVTPDQAAKFKETLEALKAKLDEFKEAADISPRRKAAARY
jgi:hypothetical protein